MAKAKRRSSSSGEETRAKIVDATLATLHEHGIVGASARAIAREGDFNQALIFYHFGSVDEAIVAAVTELSRRRLDRYRGPLTEVGTIGDLIGVARDLYANDRNSGEVTVLAQAFAGACHDPEMGPPCSTASTSGTSSSPAWSAGPSTPPPSRATPWPRPSRPTSSRWPSPRCSSA